MWILPKNYQLSSRFAQDMVDSKVDLILLESIIESSLMSRSKAMPLRTWLRRWNRVSYTQLLFSRILKPFQHTSFETALTLSLEATRVSRSQRQVKEGQKMTPDIYGHTSESIYKQLNLPLFSSRMLKDTSVEDLRVSSETYQKMILKARSGYLGRKTLASYMNGKESISLPTPTASSAEGGRQKIEYRNGFKTYRSNSNQWFGAKLRSALEINQDKDFIANPAFVEEMMGLQIGWTDIDS